MTVNGWVQIALFGAIVILITRPLGGYMTSVFAGERTFLSPVLRPVELAVYWCCGVDEKEEQHWLTYAMAVLFFSVAGFLAYCATAAAVVSAVQPARPSRDRAEQRLQHLGQLCHQHELAVLRAGNHDGLPGADGGAHGAQFRLGGDRHRDGAGADPRVCAARGEDDRQFLGRSDPRDALHADTDLGGGGSGAGLAGSAAEPGCLYRGDDARRGETGYRTRSGRLTGDRSRSSARMAAGSSTPTRRILTRTRTR